MNEGCIQYQAWAMRFGRRRCTTAGCGCFLEYPHVSWYRMAIYNLIKIMKIMKMFVVIFALGVSGAVGEPLVNYFENPPNEFSPGTFWYWLNGYMTEADIDADPVWIQDPQN